MRRTAITSWAICAAILGYCYAESRPSGSVPDEELNVATWDPANLVNGSYPYVAYGYTTGFGDSQAEAYHNAMQEKWPAARDRVIELQRDAIVRQGYTPMSHFSELVPMPAELEFVGGRWRCKVSFGLAPGQPGVTQYIYWQISLPAGE